MPTVVKPLKPTTMEEREAYLRDAAYNVANIPSKHVSIDTFTDSGVGAVTPAQLSAGLRADESYAGSDSYQRFKSVVGSLIGVEDVFPVHQGRAAEHVILKSLLGPGDVVLSNGLFDTAKGIGQALGISHEEFSAFNAHPSPEDDAKEEKRVFNGNTDLRKLKDYLSRSQREHKERKAIFVLSLTNNIFGGQPVSMPNIVQLKEILRDHRIPLVVDGCRMAENAYAIKKHDAAYRDKSVKAIIAEMISGADVVYASAKKDGLSHMGGFIATDQTDLATTLKANVTLYEGFYEYGGLAASSLEQMAEGLTQAYSDAFQEHRHGQLAYFADQLKSMDLPVVGPVGSSAVFLDARSILPHVPVDQFPAVSLVNELYVKSGIRSYMFDSFVYGTFDGTELVGPHSSESVRLSVPRLSFFKDHIDYICGSLERVRTSADSVQGYRVTSRPSQMAYAFSTFEPIEQVTSKDRKRTTVRHEDRRRPTRTYNKSIGRGRRPQMAVAYSTAQHLRPEEAPLREPLQLKEEWLSMSEDYSEVTQTHVKSNEILSEFASPHLAAMEFENKSKLTVCDYGTATGSNSMVFMEDLIAQAKKTNTQLSSSIVYNDLCIRDVEALHANVRNLEDLGNVELRFEEGSFYHGVVGQEQLDVGLSVNTMHWQDWVAKKDLGYFRDRARQDYADFLSERCREMKPGGMLFLANSIIPEGNLHPLLHGMEEVLQEMLDEKLITESEHRNMYFPMYMRSEHEFLAPFLNDRAGNLFLKQSKIVEVPCQFSAAYQASPQAPADKWAYAEGIMQSRRSWAESSVKQWFGESHAQGEPVKTNLFFERYKQKVFEEPDLAKNCGNFLMMYMAIAKRSAPEQRKKDAHRPDTKEDFHFVQAAKRAPMLNHNFPAPDMHFPKVHLLPSNNMEIVVSNTVEDELKPVLLADFQSQLLLTNAANAAILYLHVLNGQTSKSEECFLVSHESELGDASAATTQLDLRSDLSLKAELLRDRRSADGKLKRKVYRVDYTMGDSAKGSIVLHASFPADEKKNGHGCSIPSEAVLPLLSPYLSEGSNLRKDKMVLDAPQTCNGDGFHSSFHMETTFTSPTDCGGFHLSAITADEAAEKAACAYLAESGYVNINRVASSMFWASPVRDESNIPIRIQHLDEHAVYDESGRKTRISLGYSIGEADEAASDSNLAPCHGKIEFVCEADEHVHGMTASPDTCQMWLGPMSTIIN